MFTFVALLSAGLLGAAAACDCFPPQPDDPKCGRDDQYVLVGVGVSNEPIPCVYADVPEDARDDIFFGLQDGVTLAKFRVTTVLSQPEGGALQADDVVDIRSGVASNLCGYQVQPDMEYVLFTSARGLEDCELEENRPQDPVLGVEALTLPRIIPSLGTGSCSGNIFEPTDEQLAQLEADCSAAPDNEGPTDLDCGLPGLAPCASGNCGDLTLHLRVCIDVPTGDGVCGALGEEACADTTSGCLGELEEIDDECQLCGDLGEPPCSDGCGFNYQEIAGTCLLELNDAFTPDDIIEVEDSNGDFEGLAIIDIASGATVRLTHMSQETVDLSEYPEGLGVQAEFLNNDLVESVTFETDAGYSHTEYKFTYDMFGTNGGGAWPDLIPGRVTLTVTARFTDGNEAQHETVIDFEGPVPEVTRGDRGFFEE